MILNALKEFRHRRILYKPNTWAHILADLRGASVRLPEEPETHLKAAMDWLCRAQDATSDGGVSRSYHIARHSFLHVLGWAPSYPETTGYIIETFYDFAGRTGQEEYSNRATRMARWESEVQMEAGAVQGGVISEESPTPAVFNTGQVLLGWERAYRETGEEVFLQSALRAADFLIREQDPNGAWIKGLSNFATGTQHTYNARTAYALAQLYKTTGEEIHARAAEKNLDFVISMQHENGWFENCCLLDPDRPLLHTIAYTIRGLLEGGVILEQERFISAAIKSADALLGAVRRDGSMPGCFDSGWRGAAPYCCLTGQAQMAIVWLKLEEMTGDKKYREAAERVMHFLMSLQDLNHPDPGVRGGIRGSFPIWGSYGSYEMLNWAAKFFADALMLLHPSEKKHSDPEMESLAVQSGSLSQ
jgi:uncharacterized protein YyaL (SSP411 family)